MRPLVPPAPRAIGHALDVGGAQSVEARVAAEDDLGAVLVVRAVDDAPPPVFQGEGANAGAHHHCSGTGGRCRRPLFRTQTGGGGRTGQIYRWKEERENESMELTRLSIS